MHLIDFILDVLLISDVRKGESKHEVLGYFVYAVLAIALIALMFFLVDLVCDGALEQFMYSALPPQE